MDLAYKVLIYHSDCLWGFGYVEADHIHILPEFQDAYLPCVIIANPTHDIVADYLGVKTPQLPCEGLTHIPVPDDPDRFSLDFKATVLFPSPKAPADFGISGIQFVEKGQQHAKGMLPNRIPVSLRGCSQENPFAPGIFHVDIFQACPQAADELKGGGPVQQFAVDRKPAAQDQALVSPDFIQDFFTGTGIVQVVFKPESFKFLDQEGMVFVQVEYFHISEVSELLLFSFFAGSFRIF